jgi:hypothetical protein
LNGHAPETERTLENFLAEKLCKIHEIPCVPSAGMHVFNIQGR